MNRKPKIFISKCIEQDHCRWNGAITSSVEVKNLMPFIDLYTACPEADIGLGIPRDPIRLVSINDEVRLIQPATNKDLTDQMKDYCNKLISTLDDMDGFILRSKSPSCGIKEVKIHQGTGSKTLHPAGAGIFAQIVLDTFPYLPIEDEGRLTNFKIREHFLTAIFTINRFKEIKQDLDIKKLMLFQAEHKFLFLAYNQSQMRKLGKIAANLDKADMKDVFENYEKNLYQVFNKLPRYNNVVNVWNHIQGFFSENLKSSEKKYILKKIEDFRDDKLPAIAITELLHSYALRYENEYILNQYFFKPFPEELISY
jgi:uncharacterized protein YbgA (DUF1722 family)/uncharacterized protein YbbK (DUF523 family)